MSVNVIERVILQALLAADLVPADTYKDRWHTGQAIRELMSTRGQSFRGTKVTPSSRKVGHITSSQRIKARRVLIVDSGASLHLVDKKECTSTELSTLRRLPKAIELHTANGGIYADEEVRIHVDELGIWVWALALDDTPAVLSLGKLCTENNFRYEWEPSGSPYLQLADGPKIYLDVSQNVLGPSASCK